MKIEDFKPMIESMAHKYCINYNDYEDYVQAGYLTVCQLFDRIQKRNEKVSDEILKIRAGIWVRNRFIDLGRATTPYRLTDTVAANAEAPKDMDITIVEVCTGLNDRQKKVFGYLLDGYTDDVIAKKLDISERTLRNEKKVIREVLHDVEPQ